MPAHQNMKLAIASTAMLAIFSGTYITKLPVSPVYFFSALGVVFFLISLSSLRVKAPANAWYEFLLVSLAMATIGLMQIDLGGNFSNIANLALGPLILVSLLVIGSKLSKSSLLIISNWHIGTSIALIAIECAYRIANPDYDYLANAFAIRGNIDDIAFYAYKFNSIMYIDSNFVGLQLAILFAFICVINEKYQKVSLWVYMCVIVLTALTLSRASLVTLVVLYVTLKFHRASILCRVTIMLISIITFGVTLYIVAEDASFLSKFEILFLFKNYLDYATINELLFGVGAGQASNMLGIGAHNILVTYWVEIGLIGSILFFFYWSWMVYKAPAVLFLLTAWVVNGFSLTTLAIPYLYVAAGMLRLLQCKKTLNSCNETGIPNLARPSET